MEHEDRNTYAVGERVMFTHPNPEWDGKCGTVRAAYPGGYYDVEFDDGTPAMRIWESKLDPPRLYGKE